MPFAGYVPVVSSMIVTGTLPSLVSLISSAMAPVGTRISSRQSIGIRKSHLTSFMLILLFISYVFFTMKGSESSVAFSL